MFTDCVTGAGRRGSCIAVRVEGEGIVGLLALAAAVDRAAERIVVRAHDRVNTVSQVGVVVDQIPAGGDCRRRQVSAADVADVDRKSVV